MKRILTYLILLFPLIPVVAQRQMEYLDRGVVALNKGNNQLYVSWRFLATDPDNIAFNVYRAPVYGGTATKLNAEPISSSTNLTWKVTGLGLNIATKIFVKPVINGIEGEEEGSWELKANTGNHHIVRDYDFEPFPAGYPDMTMKFCWPGDLDGDGKYDFVLDRRSAGVVSEDGGDETSDIDGTSPPVHIDAYNSDGTFKWRINMGHNVNTTTGHNDMVTVYDMDGDNKAEVLLAVSEGTTFPDGTVITGANGKVTDYNSIKGSAPQWVAIVNGETGCLIDTVRLSNFDKIATERTDKWKHVGGHFAIAYLDGIHPSLIYQYKNRQASGHFTGSIAAWSYINGKLVEQWDNLFGRNDTEYESHQVRVADVDFDGKDEFLEISYAIDDDGSSLYTVDNIAHGDRHCVADIDPDRPGLEHFFVQQTNIMGMGYFDAGTGEMLSSHYLASVYDVGRGVCLAMDINTRGMQYYATMNDYAIYDSKGKPLEGAKGSFPAEALWWGGDLSRRSINAAGGDKNPVIEKFSQDTKSIVRETNLYKENNGNGDYYFVAPNGGRAAFWGDLLGDWREELIYMRRNKTGFVILSTYDETDRRQYCLMQNPGYRCQTTARGYYQTADVDFYMAADMPLPPVPPVQKADIYLTDDNSISSQVNGKSIMIDIRNPNTNISLNGNLSPSKIWFMNPKGKNHIISGEGKLTGDLEIVKSLLGEITLYGNHDYTGLTRISEGKLSVNGTINSPVMINARGILSGNANLNGIVTLEKGLNIEGGRIEPGYGNQPGQMTINGNLELPGRNCIAFDIDQNAEVNCDNLHIKGDFIVNGSSNYIVIIPGSSVKAGVINLITFTGTTNITEESFIVKGLEGVPYEVNIGANSLSIEIKEPHESGSVLWTGSINNLWDFRTENFLKGTSNEIFVPGDAVSFTDNAVSKNIVINEMMPVGSLSFTNDSDFSISGEGAISGNGGVTKTGSGKLSMLNEGNTFLGKVEISNGILEVASIKNGGVSSSIGASSSDAENWVMRNATLQTAGQMSTDRNMLVEGKLTVNNPLKTTSIMIGGDITGNDISLDVTGLGTLNIQGKTSFKDVFIKSGELALGSYQANYHSLQNADIVFENGSLQMYNVSNFVGNQESDFNIEVPDGAIATLKAPSRWTLKGKLTGKGTFNINIPYSRLDLNGNWSEFEGLINVTGYDFRINNTYGYGNATLNINSGVTVSHLSSGSKTVKLGSLSGVKGSKLGGSNITWLIGGNNCPDCSFAGNITSDGTSKLTKEGTGTITLSGENTYSGMTTVSAGALFIANASGSATGSGDVMVSERASFGGNGTMSGNLTICPNASLTLDNEKCETITIKGTMTTSGDMYIDVNSLNKQSDIVNAGGSVFIFGTTSLNINNTGSQPLKAGDEFRIFNCAKTVEGKFETITPSLEDDLIWDQSRLSEGIISVVSSTAIDNITNNQKEIKNVIYYNLTGAEVSQNTKGFVIRKVTFIDGSIVSSKIFN